MSVSEVKRLKVNLAVEVEPIGQAGFHGGVGAQAGLLGEVHILHGTQRRAIGFSVSLDSEHETSDPKQESTASWRLG